MGGVSTVTIKGQVTIPVAIRESLGLKPRERVVFVKEGNRIYLKPIKSFLEMGGSLPSKRRFVINSMKRAARGYVVQRHKSS